MIALIMLVLIQPLFVAIALLNAKLILWKMEHDLETWIEYGTGQDIFRCKAQRLEFKHYTDKEENRDNPKKVLIEIRKDLKEGLMLPVYFKILWLLIKGKRF